MNYIELLNKYKIIKQLSYIQFFAYFGAWFSNVAIYSMLVDFDASSFLVSCVVAMNFLPAILLSPISGSLVDRLPVGKLMIGLLSIELMMTISFFTIQSIDDIYFLMLFLFIRMGSASMFFTTEMTLLPKLVKDEALAKANEIHSIIWSFTFTVGMAVGGVVVHYLGTKIAFLIDICFFIVAIFILFNIKFDVVYTKSQENIFYDIKDGLSYLFKNKRLFHYILLHSSVGLTSFDALVTLLADYNYKYIIAVPLSIGITNGIRALALMVGPFIISNWVDRSRLFYLFIFQGLAILLWAILQYDFYIALVGVFITGLVTTTLWSYSYAMLQEEVDSKYLGRVLSYNEMIFMLSNIITTMFIGFGAKFMSLSLVTVVLAVLFFIVAYYYRRVFLWKKI